VAGNNTVQAGPVTTQLKTSDFFSGINFSPLNNVIGRKKGDFFLCRMTVRDTEENSNESRSGGKKENPLLFFDHNFWSLVSSFCPR
jgi:hypothetical protein